MDVFTLLENTKLREELTAEHGLSLYLEACGKRILFDCGQSGAFAENARNMGVELSKVDFMVLSHGHYDHGGGLQTFLRCNDHAPVYVNSHVFEPHYHGPEKYIGLDPALRESRRFRYVENELNLGSGIRLIPGKSLPQPFGSEPYGLNVEENGSFRPDDFLHEQYLEISENGQKILLSGCSHRGILNIADFFRPDILIGGFHFKKLDPAGGGAEVLRKSARILMDYPTRYFTCHCTGTAQYEFLKAQMGEKLSYLATGSHISL